MKHHLLSSLMVLMLGGMAFNSSAVEPTLNYKEDFTTLFNGASSGNMSRTNYGYPAHYWIREGVTTKNMTANTTYDSNAAATTKRSIGWSVANQGSASNSSEALVPPKVGGTVKFWVHRSISSTTSTLASEVEIYTMTVDNAGVWTRKSLGTSDGTFDGITLAGINDAKAIVGNDLNTWKQVTINNIPDQTYLGIRLNGLLIDDFEASKAWEEWPDYVWDGTIIPYIDITELGTNYTKYYLNEDNSFLSDNGQPYQLPVQLKMTVNAGKPTEDMFKYRFQLSFTGHDPLHITDAQGNDVILTFDTRPNHDWQGSTKVNNHEEKDLAFAIRNMDPKYFNTNASLQAVKVDANGQDVGNPISMQRKNTVATDGTWNATSWSNFQFEALVPQPIIVYSITTPTSTTTASSWKGNTLSDYHPWFINPVSNEAPIYIGNTAGRAEMKITRIEFDSANFGLKENITLPVTVGPEGLLNLKPSIKATQPGVYKGVMSVYVDGIDEPFVAKLEGAVKPDYDTKYLFHKEDGSANATMPEGWLATGNWQIASLTANQQKVDNAWTQAASTFGNTPANVILSSPKMNFEDGAQVWFDATCYQTTGAMEVLYSPDRANWQVLKTMKVGPITPTVDNPLTDDMFNTFFTTKSSYNENLFKTFYITVPQAGEGYIAFRTSSNQARVDNVVMDGTPVEVDFDVAYISQAIPNKFAVNKPKEVKVTFRNLISTINAGEYDVQIVADGIVARSFAGNKDLTTGTDVVLSTNYAFASDGEHTLAFNLVKGQNIVSTETASVNVVNEGYDEQFQVGPSHTTNMLSDDWNGWPLTPATNYAVTSEAIYPAALLQDLNPNGSSAANNGINFDPNGTMTGLKAGDKITSIGWIAYAGAIVPGITSAELPVELYLENTTDATYANNSVEFKTDSEITNVYKGKVIFDLTKTNSQRNASTAAPGTLVDMEEPLFKIILDEPFEYTGNNLRVQLRIPKVYFNQNSPVEDAEYFSWTSNNSSIGGQLMALDSKGINTNDYRILYSSGVSSRSVSAQLPMLLMTKETPANLLTGKVSDSRSKEGIAGVTVTASSEEGVTFTATTGEDGTYEMEVGNPGFDFTVTATADKYYPYTSKQTVNLADGNKTHDIVLTETAILIQGKVADKNGALEGATVTLTAVDEAADFTPLTATTDAEGNYIFKTELINTDYFVKAEAQYYISQQIRLSVTDIDKTVQTITLVHLASLIDGTVRNEDGAPVKDAKVSLKVKDQEGEPQTYTTGENGMFLFTTDILDTDYILTIEADGYVTYTQDLEVGTSNIALGNITLKYVTVSINGTVTDESGNAIEGASVKLTTDDNDYNPLTATTGADGKFSIATPNLNSQLTLTVAADGFDAYTTTVDVAEADVNLETIKLAFCEIEIAGKVITKEGKPIAGAVVTLQATGDDSMPMTATTGSNGTFSFTTRAHDSEFAITVTHDDFKSYSGTINTTDSDLSLDDIVLEANEAGIGSIYFDGITVTPGFGNIDIKADGCDVVVIDLSGHVIASFSALNGEATVDGLSAGIYIVNNVKVIVR